MESVQVWLLTFALVCLVYFPSGDCSITGMGNRTECLVDAVQGACTTGSARPRQLGRVPEFIPVGLSNWNGAVERICRSTGLQEFRKHVRVGCPINILDVENDSVEPFAKCVAERQVVLTVGALLWGRLQNSRFDL